MIAREADPDHVMCRGDDSSGGRQDELGGSDLSDLPFSHRYCCHGWLGLSLPSRTEIFHAAADMSENGRGAAAAASIRRRGATAPLFFARGGLVQLRLHPTRAAAT